MAEPKATIQVDANTKAAEATLGEFATAMATAFRSVQAEAEDSSEEIEKSFLQTEVSMRTVEKGVKLVGRAFEAFGDAVVSATELAGKHDRRVHDLEKSYDKMVSAFGRSVASSGAWQASVEALTEATTELQKVFASPEGKEAINKFFQFVAKSASDAINAMLGMLKIFKDIKDELEIQFGQGFVAEPLNEQGQTPFEALTSPFENLANSLANAGTAGAGGRSIAPPGKGKKGGGPTGALGSSSLTETFSATELGISNIEILQADADEFARLQDEVFDAKTAHLKRMADLDVERLVAERQEVDFRNAVRAEEAEKQRAHYELIASITAQGIGNMVGELVTGRAKVGPAMAKLFGTLIAQIVPALVGMATATTASGAAAATVGTPAAIVTGPLLAAAAAAFGSIVASLGAGLDSRGKEALASAKAGQIPSFARTGADLPNLNLSSNQLSQRAPRTLPFGGGTSQTFNVYFGATAIVGSEDEVARKIAALSRRADRLSPGGA